MFCTNATKVPAFLWLLGAGSQISSTFTDKTPTQYDMARPAHPTCYSSGKSRKKHNKENKLVRHDTLGKGGWRFVQCLYNTGQAQHKDTVHIRGNGLIRRQRQRNTPHKQTSTQKKENKTKQKQNSLSATHSTMGKNKTTHR